MKILAFSDVHCGFAACNAIVAAAAEADLVIGAGDFAQRREGLAETMAILEPIADKAIYGFGGAIPELNITAFESFDITEAEPLLVAAEGADIIICHSPPKGLADVMASCGSMGSVEIRDTIVRVQPRLMVCGHVHDCWGERGQIGQTEVANLGPRVNWIKLEL